MNFLNAVSLLETGHPWSLWVSPSLLNLSYPIVLPAWGGEQGNAMYAFYAYLSLPFLKIFGYSLGVFRLPMLSLSLLGAGSVASIAWLWKGKRLALIVGALLAVSPYMILMSRYALESLAYGNLLFMALALFLFGVRYRKLIVCYGAMCLFGVSMYAYGLSLISAPFIVLACLFLGKRQWKFPHLAGMAAAYGLVALPFFLYILINFYSLPTIETGFFSIPSLGGNRSNEFIFMRPEPLWFKWNAVKYYLKLFIGMALQYPQEQEAFMEWGTFYRYTVLFFLLGLVILIKRTMAKHKTSSSLPIGALILLVIAIYAALGAMIHPGNARINPGWYAYGLTSALGLWVLRQKMPWLFLASMICYAISLTSFARAFFTGDHCLMRQYGDDVGLQYYQNPEDFHPRGAQRAIKEAFDLIESRGNRSQY